MRQMMTCAAALLVVACGTEATASNAAAGSGKTQKGNGPSHAISSTPGAWSLSGPKKIGVQLDPDGLHFDPLLLSCESGSGGVTLMFTGGIEQSPAKQTVIFIVNGRTITVPISVAVDDWDSIEASVTVGTAHPLLTALGSAQSIRMNTSGETYALPVQGLKANWNTFKRACGIAQAAGFDRRWTCAG